MPAIDVQSPFTVILRWSIHSLPLWGYAAVLWGVGLTCSPSMAITVGQVDDFSSNLQGWQQGHSPAGLIGVTWAAQGGRLGSNDPFLRLQSDGNGSNGKLVVFNTSSSGPSAWSGNYVDAQIDTIAMDVINLGNTDINLRLAFGTGSAPVIGGGWLSSLQGIRVPAQQGWTRIEFPISALDLQGVQGVGTNFRSVMTNVAALRILHATSPDNNGSTITGTIGIDNISALRRLPEPATGVAAIWISLAALHLRRRSQGIQPG